MSDSKRTCVYDPLVEFMRHFATAPVAVPEVSSEEERTIEEVLQRRIVEGNRLGIQQDLDKALRTYSPVAVINDILLEGMRVVGELFGSGQMQLPFVLQSAETMKTAVAYLEQFMERTEGTRKGTMVLATVKGDVHDIGKNLVDIILTNNGYQVVNLGIKVSVEAMLAAVEEHRADAIGMSGLLVKSTVIMKENLELMEHRGVRIPVVLGGAALTRRYVEQDLRSVYSGILDYAGDAFDGLSFMQRLQSSNEIPPTDQTVSNLGTERRRTVSAGKQDVAARSSVRRTDIPLPPFWGSKVVTNIPLEKVFEYINEVALIRGQWQVRKGKRSGEEYQRELEAEILPKLDELKLRVKRESIFQPAVVYGYFPCNSDGNDLVIHRPAGVAREELHSTWLDEWITQNEWNEWLRFHFPRQEADRRLCIADFFAPVSEGRLDVCAFQIVTMGASASDFTARLFTENRYQEYLFLHGLSVECAEALAEYWHKSIRRELGINHHDAADIRKLFAQGYQGSRYSFGYPACPDLEEQIKVFELLRPERVGVSLTEEFQLVPEQSTSALIVHHPEARYFNIR